MLLVRHNSILFLTLPENRKGRVLSFSDFSFELRILTGSIWGMVNTSQLEAIRNGNKKIRKWSDSQLDNSATLDSYLIEPF